MKILLEVFHLLGSTAGEGKDVESQDYILFASILAETDFLFATGVDVGQLEIRGHIANFQRRRGRSCLIVRSPKWGGKKRTQNQQTCHEGGKCKLPHQVHSLQRVGYLLCQQKTIDARGTSGCDPWISAQVQIQFLALPKILFSGVKEPPMKRFVTLIMTVALALSLATPSFAWQAAGADTSKADTAKKDKASKPKKEKKAAKEKKTKEKKADAAPAK
jgi:hypothetical protein